MEDTFIVMISIFSLMAAVVVVCVGGRGCVALISCVMKRSERSESSKRSENNRSESCSDPV